ncbi:hypothetical protein [Deinococcus alpinitundrae]|uniref:hypothetical protein n=1 Tax=Deinococcus alpinitundrae TaxID=468913 RepID=UPI00137B5D27|nr:hypothetical protein [Deinococcus alpinitundrae]
MFTAEVAGLLGLVGLYQPGLHFHDSPRMFGGFVLLRGVITLPFWHTCPKKSEFWNSVDCAGVSISIAATFAGIFSYLQGLLDYLLMS